MIVQEPLRAYSEREVSQLLGLTSRQIRQCVRDGLLSCPADERRDFRFSFEDLVLLRSAKSLIDAAVPLREVRGMLRRLREERPSGESLCALRFSVEGREILVGDGEVTWHVRSGQTRLDFDPRPCDKTASPVPAGASCDDVRTAELATAPLWEDPADEAEAGRWTEAACELEAHDPAAAREAYRHALRLDSRDLVARVNLGRLLHEAGDLDDAETEYRRALALDPDHATATFNLGVVLEDRDLLDEALECYETAVELDPMQVDAYHNAVRLYERRGEKAAAVRLLKRLREICS